MVLSFCGLRILYGENGNFSSAYFTEINFKKEGTEERENQEKKKNHVNWCFNKSLEIEEMLLQLSKFKQIDSQLGWRNRIKYQEDCCLILYFVLAFASHTAVLLFDKIVLKLKRRKKTTTMQCYWDAQHTQEQTENIPAFICFHSCKYSKA